MRVVGRRCGAWLGLLAFLLFWSVAGNAVAAGADPYVPAPSTARASIAGDWLVESHDAVIRIELVGDEYQGYILWQLHDTYGPEDGPELNGKTVTDRNNPDPALRSRPLTGLRLLTGLKFDLDSKKWKGGHVYNSDDGRTYNCWVRLRSPDRLQLHGYIGISLFGGSTVWSRVTMRTPAPGRLPFVPNTSDK